MTAMRPPPQPAQHGFCASCQALVSRHRPFLLRCAFAALIARTILLHALTPASWQSGGGQSRLLRLQPTVAPPADVNEGDNGGMVELPYTVSETDMEYARRLKTGVVRSMEEAMAAPTPTRRPQEEVFHAQMGEDKFVLNRFFETAGPDGMPLRRGTFLELGALDGDDLSNTYYFERDLGWRGVLIEGTPAHCDALLNNRGHVSVAYCGAVCPSSARGNITWMGEDPIAGSPDVGLTEAHRQAWGEDRFSSQTTVACAPLGAILKASGLRHVNFWSLDVEGAEGAVLSTIDWDQFSFDVLVVELDAPDSDQRRIESDMLARRILLRQGYRFATRLEANEVWVSAAVYDRADLSDLQPPPEPQAEAEAVEPPQPEAESPADPQQAAGAEDPPAEQQSRRDEGVGPHAPPVVILPSMVDARPAHQAPFDPSRPPPAPVAAAEDGGQMAPREPPPEAIL